MKDIFSELYKKVMSFFNNEVKEENSKDTACNRLKLVLMQDRAKMEPSLMEKMREEMIEIISKYVEIDKEALDLNIEAEGESFALMLNIPVLRAKTREEVEAQEGIVIDDDEDDDDEENEDIENSDEEEKTKEEINESENQELKENSENDEVSTKKAEKIEEITIENISSEEEKKTEEEKPEEKHNVNTSVSDKEKNDTNKNISNQPPLKKKIKHQKDEDL